MQKQAVNSDAVAVDPPGRGGGRRAMMANEPQGRLFKGEDGSIRAFSGNYYFTLMPPNREIVMRCSGAEQWLNNNQQLVFRIAQRWSRGGNSLRTMQFTDEQKQQMKLVSDEPIVPLSPRQDPP